MSDFCWDCGAKPCTCLSANNVEQALLAENKELKRHIRLLRKYALDNWVSENMMKKFDDELIDNIDELD